MASAHPTTPDETERASPLLALLLAILRAYAPMLAPRAEGDDTDPRILRVREILQQIEALTELLRQAEPEIHHGHVTAAEPPRHPRSHRNPARTARRPDRPASRASPPRAPPWRPASAPPRPG